MSEPLTDSSSAQASQEDILHFEDEDDNDIADDIVDENEEEVSHSHSPSPAEEIQEPKQFIFPQNSGYFRIFADKANEKKTSLTSTYGSKSKLTIIGLFGRERSVDSCKGVEIFDYIAQRDIFSVLTPLDPDEIYIDGFHDYVNSRIYLNLRSDKTKDLRYMQLTLLMFEVCHILICFHPSYNFDQSYLRHFQCLESARSRLMSPLSKKLRNLKKLLPKYWPQNGRSCTPRLIFYFAKCPLELRGSKGTTEIIKKTGKLSKHPPIRRLEFSIEDQIHRIFKRARITHTASNLFNLPAKDNYVYVNNGMNEDAIGESTQDALEYFYDQLETEIIPTDDSYSAIHEFTPTFYQQTVKDAYENNSRSFGSFLANHLETMVQRGPDNIDGAKATSELPTADQWYKAMTVTLETITMKDVDPESHLGKVKQILYSHIDIDTRFSESRCAKALPMAFAAYKENLQSHYLAEVHNAKMLQAMNVFSHQARGPASKKYAELLIEECTNFWMAGRQMCEELSLTGNHCINRKHKISNAEDTENKNLPTLPHRSSVTFLSACNCGRRQSTRDDPFNLLDANYAFYSDLENDCCRDLERTPVPIFQGEDDEEGQLQSLASLKKQTSTITAVPYMPTKAESTDELPAFPSWTLTHIGASTIYSHSSGVNQTGFLSGCRNLHSWDVPLKKINFKALQAKFPNLAENAMKRANFHPSKKGVEMGVTAKIFIGMEYECPRGNRFISGTLDKAVRTTKETGSGSRFINNDVPLYLACPSCRPGSRGQIAQLMRIHVVTPKAPVKILFKPVVIPCLNGPEFHPGWKTPPDMPIHAYWVLRLPFIYCGKQGSHLPPTKEVPDVNCAKLLKGCIEIVEEDIDIG